MNVFVDYHHSGLLYSLHLTLEKRFGWRIYRPIGMEWFDRGFFDVAKPYGNNPETVKQFLSMNPNQKPVEGSPPLNTIKHRDPRLTHYIVEDVYHGYDQKAMTFNQFLDADIDIIIASIPDHWHTYARLRDEFKPKAKVVAHMGNMFNEVADLKPLYDINLMASTIPFNVPSKWNSVFYYQEQPVTEFKNPINSGNISSYAHVIPKKDQYEEYKKALPDFTLRAYGAGNPDGWMQSLTQLYSSMQLDMFVYHVKPGGDGYGWNWHSAYMQGRPVLTNFSDYKDKLGARLFTDGITGIDLEKRSVAENAELLRRLAQDGSYIKMAHAARAAWEEAVNYDHEADKLLKFFQNLR